MSRRQTLNATNQRQFNDIRVQERRNFALQTENKNLFRQTTSLANDNRELRARIAQLEAEQKDRDSAINGILDEAGETEISQRTDEGAVRWTGGALLSES